MIEIKEVIVNNQVFDTEFTCDLEKCKGACCTMESEFGAPLTEKEVERIDEILPTVKNYLSENSIDRIDEIGFWEKKQETLMTTSINNRDCVFVYYEGDIAKCAIEKAYFEGEVEFRKPISCHLFPIRVSDFGGPVLRFESYSECKPAKKLGKKTKINVFEFCKDALVRLYGKNWYENVKEKIGSK